LRLTVDIYDNNNNGILLPPFHYNIQTSCKQTYDTRHIKSFCSAVKHWLDLPASTTPPVSEIVSDFPLWSGQWSGWKGGLHLTQNYPDFTGIRIF